MRNPFRPLRDVRAPRRGRARGATLTETAQNIVLVAASAILLMVALALTDAMGWR